jgi:heme exporter protein D
MALGAHAGFILVAYGAAALVLSVLVLWVLIDHRIQVRAIAALEARGVRRRSGHVGAEDIH